MKILPNAVRQKINNLPLYTKISSIILLVAVFILTAALGGIQMISNTGNRLLYQSMAGSLSYSAEDISRKLTNIEDMTDMMISDSNIQNNLSTVMDTDDYIKRSDAYNYLTYTVPKYYQNFKDNGIYYMNLYNPYYTTYSYQLRSHQTPDSVTDGLLKNAEENAGYPCWTTAYGNEYGLFLTRTIRRADQLKLDHLGTILVSVDLDAVIKTSTNSVLHSGEVQYILYDGENEIYHTPSVTQEQLKELDRDPDLTYGVITLDHKAYFYVKDMIPNFQWNYICLIPYNAIASAQKATLLLCLFVIGFLTLASILLAHRILHSILKHFQTLIWKMKEFGQNETVIPENGYDYDNRKDEIGELHLQFDHMANEIQRLIQENYVQELLAKEAKIKALEYQINPHFLYNTLDSVYWRAKASDEKEISTMIESLSALLRVTLSKRKGNFTAAYEIELVHHFISIQKIRFENRLMYSENISNEIFDIELPQLTIQPLVENAINHALEEMPDTCFIHIHGFCKDSNAYIQVINTGSQFEDNLLEKLESNQIKPHGFGIGLLNIHKRLQIIYGNDYGLSFFNPDDDHAAAQICIPVKKSK